MNKVILMGRCVRDPEVRYSQNGDGSSTGVARYTLAIDRRFKREGDSQTADFISCVAFGKQCEFAEKYLLKGTKVVVEGRIQTGSYTNKDGQKVYTTDVIIEHHEFAESKSHSTGGMQNVEGANNNAYNAPANNYDPGDGFMNIPDGVEDEGLPFN